MSKPLYYDKEKDQYLFVERNVFRGVEYIHVSIKKYDPDEDFFYRIKGLTVLEPYIDYIIEGLEEINNQLAKVNLPDVRQLEFSFEEKNEQQK